MKNCDTPHEIRCVGEFVSDDCKNEEVFRRRFIFEVQNEKENILWRF